MWFPPEWLSALSSAKILWRRLFNEIWNVIYVDFFKFWIRCWELNWYICSIAHESYLGILIQWNDNDTRSHRPGQRTDEFICNWNRVVGQLTFLTVPTEGLGFQLKPWIILYVIGILWNICDVQSPFNYFKRWLNKNILTKYFNLSVNNDIIWGSGLNQGVERVICLVSYPQWPFWHRIRMLEYIQSC